jgi:hypothetical protein
MNTRTTIANNTITVGPQMPPLSSSVAPGAFLDHRRRIIKSVKTGRFLSWVNPTASNNE